MPVRILGVAFAAAGWKEESGQGRPSVSSVRGGLSWGPSLAERAQILVLLHPNLVMSTCLLFFEVPFLTCGKRNAKLASGGFVRMRKFSF